MKYFVKVSVFALALAVATACSSDPAQPNDDDDDDDPPVNPGATATLALAGNIAGCGNLPNAVGTSAIIDTLPAETVVVPLGDNVLPLGDAVQTIADFNTCYEPTWGKFKARTRAVVGNHEQKPGADGHFTYFGGAAGPAGKGWYSFNAGTWHVVVLNIHDTSPYLTDGEQLTWMRQDLAANANRTCTLVVWHDPMFLSSNTPGFTVRTNKKHVWEDLFAASVDLVVNGGQHQYERMLPMDPEGNIDQANGILQINAGVGGGSWTDVTVVHPNRAAFRTGFGVLVLKLKPGGWDYNFVSSTNPGAGNDSGSGTCH